MVLAAPPTIVTPRLRLRHFVSASPAASPEATDSRYDSDLAFWHGLLTTPSIVQWTTKGDVNTDTTETSEWILKQSKMPWYYEIECVTSPDATNLSSGSETAESESPASCPIGMVGIRFLQDKVKAAVANGTQPEIGFMLATAFQGHGYATEAARTILETFWAYSASAEDVNERFEVLEAFSDSENAASARVLRKCGFEVWKRIEKERFAPLLGEWRDTLLWRTTRPKV